MTDRTVMASMGAGFRYGWLGGKAEVYVDCATNGMAQNDTLRVIKIPAGGLALLAGIKVITVDSGATIDLGDSASATQFIDGASVASTGYVVSAATAWKAYAAEDYLVLTATDGALDTAQFVAFLFMLDLNVTIGVDTALTPATA